MSVSSWMTIFTLISVVFYFHEDLCLTANPIVLWCRGAEVDVKRLPKRPAPPRFGRKLTESQKAIIVYLKLIYSFVWIYNPRRKYRTICVLYSQSLTITAFCRLEQLTYALTVVSYTPYKNLLMSRQASLSFFRIMVLNISSKNLNDIESIASLKF